MQAQDYKVDQKFLTKFSQFLIDRQRCMEFGLSWWKVTPFLLINSGRFLSIV